MSSLILSVFLAVLVWIAAVREQNPPREADYDQNIPIEVIPPAPGLVTTDSLPGWVKLRLVAPNSSWISLTPAKFKALLDLSKLAEGFNDVPIQVNVSDSQVRIIDQTPKDVSITLQAEQTISMTIQTEINDEPPIGYMSLTPTLNPTTVTVTGPASLISQADKAITEIVIRAAKETIKRAGDIVIRNRDDQPITGLKLNPATVQVVLPIEQRFGYKDVSVSAVVKGQPAPGYWVSNISITPGRLTIVGNPQVLASIPGFIETTPIDVSQTTENIERSIPLNLPDGVTVVPPEGEPEGAGGVQVRVEVAAIQSGQTVQRPILQQGIDPDYTWSASPERADVILSGPIPRLRALKPDAVQVIVDLFGLEPGVHKVKPTVFVPDDLHLEAILPDTIEVTISLSPILTPTPTPLPIPTAPRPLIVTPTASRTTER
ncbi:MAG: CdaR family protein [Anaerolineae bacterium]